MSCATKNGTGTNEKEKGLVKDDEYFPYCFGSKARAGVRTYLMGIESHRVGINYRGHSYINKAVITVKARIRRASP